MRMLLAFSLGLGHVFAGCGGHSGSHAAATASAPWLGTWQPADSTAVFHVWLEGGAVRVEGWDSSDGEWFEVSDVGVDGGVLRFTSTMPSTKWSVVNTMALSRGVLVNERSGDSDVPTTWVASSAERPRR